VSERENYNNKNNDNNRKDGDISRLIISCRYLLS